MITNIYLFIYFIIVLTTYYLNKKNINIFFLKLLIITFLINDLLRIVTTDLSKNLFLFISKDIILATFFIISIIFFIKKKKIYTPNKYFLIFFFSSLLTIIFSYNISFLYSNIEKLISGFYDLLFYPFFILVVVFFIKNRKDLDILEKFFLALNTILLLIILAQFFDHELFMQFILNNYSDDNHELRRLISLMFQGKYTTYESKDVDIVIPSIIFSNPGRYGHYILANFLINIFFLIRKKNYTNISSALIGFILIIFSSQRASIYLSILVIIFCFLNKRNLLYLKKKLSINQNFIYIILSLLLISIGSIKYYNEKLFHNFSAKIYNIYEPITNSFNVKESDTAISLKGRLLITYNDLRKIYLEDEIDTRKILFGNGFGTHSLGIKTIIEKLHKENYEYGKHFFYEQHISTILYDTGIFGLLIYCFIFIYLNFIIQKKIKKINYPKNIDKFILITTATPIILLNTGYQFTRDYIFQFFYYLLVGLIISYIKNLKKTKSLVDY
jgi:hypothetical protein